MKITELEWLKKNVEKVSLTDVERLRELGAFRMIEQGLISMPLSKFVSIAEEIANIVGRYMEGEKNVLPPPQGQ
ncbi:hypothetical protein [Paenibacillus agilis]|uniref:Uncharacterized protein n=1 Tax=Paenibacillus agilis TaxID=3020863 RepID=A0A559IEA9_9BACL|nr:hypothetical protein [Paenibacillus agilis]TVX85992.1 hypothetical protein FPZ44_23885 [Paenibacillus agilis]